MNPRNNQVGGDHYKSMKIQPRDIILEYDLPWDLGNVIKYVLRHKKKGQPKQDIEKCIHYLQLYLENLNEH